MIPDEESISHIGTSSEMMYSGKYEEAPKRGEVYVIDGMEGSIPMSLVAAAGKDPSELSMHGAKFDLLHRGGWDAIGRPPPFLR